MRKNSQELHRLLLSMDGRSYSAYKELKGEYSFEKYLLSIDHVQSDPYAPPSKLRAILSRDIVGIPGELLDSREKRIAVSDFLTRCFWKRAHDGERRGVGTGDGGKILIDRCTQEVLERSSVCIGEKTVEARFELGLPAAGRRILGKSADTIFQEILPEIVENSLLYKRIDAGALRKQVLLFLDQEYIREELKRRDLIAFVANGAVLPRESGVSDRPLRGGIPFQSPKNLEITMELPSGQKISGMGLERGVSLIVGGGYHGKSTLLRALERGVYNHIPGDGREFVLTISDAVKIRAEDGRSVEGVDISAFINNLPGGRDTRRFSTENASGSTSQAANVAEALEAGTSLLLIDEDTSATNFMIRDRRMQKLIAKEKEPITPFVDRVRALYEELGVSTVLIVGGSGDYFDVADRIIMMDEYRPKDVTKLAREIAEEDPGERERSGESFEKIQPRIPLKSAFPSQGREDRLKAKGRFSILYGREPIELGALEQLVDDSQTNCIAAMLDYFRNHLLDDRTDLSRAADRLYERIRSQGIDAVSPYTGHPGNLSLPRKQEFCAAVNRYRGLKIK